MGSFSVSDMRQLQQQLNKIREGDVEAFVDSCAKELAARLLSKAIKRTPVGDYPQSSGKKGGTLRRGWTSRTHQEAAGGARQNAKAYVDSLTVHHFGNMIMIEIINPVEYAPYVEYGHRTSDHKGWVRGRFMLTISEQEIQKIAPQVLERKINIFLGECMK